MTGRVSQCDLIAGVLADGRPHTAAEIHRRCGFSRLNSRIAELRSLRGMNIECRHLAGVGRGPDAYEYQLCSAALLREPSAPEPAADGSLSGAADCPDAPDPTRPPGRGDTANGAAQLTLLGAAA